jgi:histidine ammonia-lyase
MDLRAPLEPARATASVRDAIRSAGVPGPGPDRHLAPEVELVVQAVQDGSVITAAERALTEPLA